MQRVIIDLAAQFFGGVVRKEEHCGSEVFIEIGRFGEASQRGAFAAIGRQDENFGIACLGIGGGKDGGDDVTGDRFGEGENAFVQVDLNVAASELQFTHAEGLRRINGQLMQVCHDGSAGIGCERTWRDAAEATEKNAENRTALQAARPCLLFRGASFRTGRGSWFLAPVLADDASLV